ncbi:MAG: hypothetical protein IT345_03465 [Trueperaceae bacterium]|nr:hypothetical protein [Trueperaceae bacterium]
MTLGRGDRSSLLPHHYDGARRREPDADVAVSDPVTTAAPRLCEIVVPLTPAIDAAEGAPISHSMRTALAAVRVGELLGLDTRALTDLYYAALLKDLGSTSARSKAAHMFGPGTGAIYHALHQADFSTLRGALKVAAPLLRTRAPLGRRLANFMDMTVGGARGPAEIERLRGRSGASIALDMGFSRGTADAILARNERWDGRGRTEGGSGPAIALGGRILNVTQNLVSAWFRGGVAEAIDHLKEHAGTRLDPEVSSVALQLLAEPTFEAELGSKDIEQLVIAAEPSARGYVSASRVDRVFSGFARFIDAKSPWKYRHSERVRELAVGAALQLDGVNWAGSACLRRLKRAALLHDVARLATPSEMIDSDRTFSDTELQLMRADQPIAPGVLDRVLDLADEAPVTETYVTAEPPGLVAEGSNALSRLECCELIHTLLDQAEKFEALTAPRPHRERKSLEEALAVLRSETAGMGEMAKAALAGLELFLATPAAHAVLAPRTFDPSAIVVVD